MICTYNPPLHLCTAAEPNECDACGGDVCEGCAARVQSGCFNWPDILWCHDENCVSKFDNYDGAPTESEFYNVGREIERDSMADCQRNFKR